MKGRLSDHFKNKIDTIKLDIDLHFQKAHKERREFAENLLLEL